MIFIRKNATNINIQKLILKTKNQFSKESNIFQPISSLRSFSNVSEPNKEVKKGFLEKYFGFESNTAAPEFKNRWLMVAPAFFTHMCIGSPYAWSIMGDVLTKELGFVAPAAADWTLMQSAFPLSLVFLLMGTSSSLFGKWQIKVGTRKSMAAASLCFGGGILLGSAGVMMHSLPLLYMGYGVLGGIGIGLAYTPPVQSLLQWFPDKKGIASGLTIAGFGSGALVFTPCVQYLMKKFAKMPEYLGPASDFVTKTVDGKLFAEVNNNLVEVVQAGAAELAKISYSLPEGLYVVGSGASGASEALAVMGLTYFSVMAASSLLMKNPHPSYKVASMDNSNNNAAVPAPSAVKDITVDEAMKKPQFYLLGLSFFSLATGGMGMFSVAKPMMSEVFSAALPSIVTSAFAANFILMLSGGNLGGRLGWAAVSDKIGRRKTMMIFTLGSIPIYLSLPYLIDNVVTTGSSAPLYGFCLSTVAAISMMGGVYAILPAYESDLFGTKYVGAIHGRMLIFSALAALAGPNLLIYLRSMSEKKAMAELLEKISPETFQKTFGTAMENASDLIATKTLTIGKLLAISPPGTIDPTPYLYNTTMYTLSGLMAMAVVSHALVKPIKPTEGKVVEVKDVSESESSVDSTTVEETVGDRKVK